MNRHMMRCTMMPCFDYASCGDDPEMVVREAETFWKMAGSAIRAVKRCAARVARSFSWACSHYTPRPACCDPIALR